jgi:hypothetical protein
MVGWRNNFGLIEGGNSDIDFISIGLAHEISAPPHVAQNERTRPAHAISRDLPLVN